MIATEDIMFWLPGLTDNAGTFVWAVRDVADAINWRAPEERREHIRTLRTAAQTRSTIGDRGGARGFLFLAWLLLASLRVS